MTESTDMNVRDALARIGEMIDPASIEILVTGDERKTVLDAAEKRIRELRGPKQGEEQTKTRKTGDIQGEKSITPSPLTPSVSRSFITCDDVLVRA